MLFLRLIKWLVSKPQERTFRFWYQRHPFDDRQFFSVTATDQASANAKAGKVFDGLFQRHVTVMTLFYPA